MIPSVVLTTALFVTTVIFTGSVANPTADPHHARIGVIKLDKGVPDGPMNISERVVAGIVNQPQQPSEAVSWQQFHSVEEAATTAIADNQLFAAIILPEDYSAKLSSLLVANLQRPEITVLTNPGSGTMAAAIGSPIAESATRGGSMAAAGQLLAHAPGAISPADAVLITDPVTIAHHQALPFGDRTGMA
ncbi:YhgE/Pip domain-containing protein [Nocardia sp. NPDC047654]|uniref:YhgE/Pip domain-containing protein n=1 Tax=Nocardia sp. NPDC047654 TaxID=3364314 RepID=UPI003713C54C